MEKKDIIEIDVSEIPEELGKTLEERVDKWLDLLEKGISLVNKRSNILYLNTNLPFSLFISLASDISSAY